MVEGGNINRVNKVIVDSKYASLNPNAVLVFVSVPKPSFLPFHISDENNHLFPLDNPLRYQEVHT